MAAFKINIDKLEIAYYRRESFENKLLSAFDDGCEEELDESLMIHIEDLSTDESDKPASIADYLCKGLRVNISLDDDEKPAKHIESDTIKIGNWYFTRNSFPGHDTAYKYNYLVERAKSDGGRDTLGFLYFDTYYLKRKDLYLYVSNELLYNDRWRQMIWDFETDMELSYKHICKVDIALDSTINVSKAIYNLVRRNKEVEWLVNGRCITNRDELIKGLFWLTCGTLNNPDEHRELYIKQFEGLMLNCYDKTTEIVDKSHKNYQITTWDTNKDKNIYRNEVRLNRKNIIDYTKAHGLNDELFRDKLETKETRFKIYRDIVRKMLRWNIKRRSNDITTLIQNDSTSR